MKPFWPEWARATRGALCGVLFSLVIVPAALSAPAASKPAAADSPAADASPSPTPPATVSLAEIAEQAQTATTTLEAIDPAGAPDGGGLATLRQDLPDLSARINQLQTENSKTIENAGASLETLRNLQSGWRKIEETLAERTAALNGRAKTLETELAQIQNTEKLWQATREAAQKADAPAETRAAVQRVLAASSDALRRVKERQTRVLELQSRVSELAGQVRTSQAAVRQANSAALRSLFVRDSAPLWAPRARLDDIAAATEEGESLGQQASALLAYVRQQPGSFLAHAGIILALWGVMLWLRRGLHKWTEEEPHLKRAVPIFDVPLAAAIALSFLFKGALYADAPALLKAILGAVLLLPTVVVLRRLLEPRLYPALYFLVAFYFVDAVRVATAIFPVLNRWVFSVEIVGAILVFLWLVTSGRMHGDPARQVSAILWRKRLYLLSSVLLAGALVAAALGYVRLGTVIGTAVLRSGYAAVFIYALLQVLEGLMLVALRVRPLTVSKIARDHRHEVERRVSRVLLVAALLVWFVLTLDYFQLRIPVYERLTQVLSYAISAGSLSISLGRLLGFALAIWLSIVVSRMIRFFLNEEIYDRMNLAPGLPYAISTLLNYVVLLVGFLIALGLLGVDLTKVTILAGAFSVGLGFGLQNIINNFVSGIILLFERPVKVGDIIQIGDAVGEVRRIGIRASVIHTRDGSTIVMPNGNLISNQFTNWTYSDRHRAIEVPITVASGADPNRVMELLQQTAATQNLTKDRPEPQAYVTGITGSAMNLVVRAWINHYEDWVKSRSELAIALTAALARENIKLG